MAFTIGIGPGGFHIPVPGGPGPHLPPTPVPPVLGPGGFQVGPGGIAQPPHFPMTGPGGFPIPLPGAVPGSPVPITGYGPGGIGSPPPGAVPGGQVSPQVGPGGFGGQPGGGQMNPGSPDAQLAHSISQHLSNALAAVNDPELRQSLATAMATLHKYVAARHKENLDALAGKASVRHLSHVYGTIL